MKRYLFISIALMAILILTLSGCGGGNSPGTEAPITIAESLVPATAATSFPTGTNDLGGNCTTVTYPYYLAQTEVTYQQWSVVHTWAVSHGYIFANPGTCGGFNDGTHKTYSTGHETHPVTNVSWRDAIVWCNALTEYYNAHNGTSMACVYTDGLTVIRDSGNAALCDSVIPDTAAKGFRLPTSMEWELAARYKDGTAWTPGNCASGATDAISDAAASGAVAWYNANSNVPDPVITSTQPVGQKTANALGISDMSGNVSEWCFDIESGTTRVTRGGTWFNLASWLQIGLVSSGNPPSAYNTLGFRVARSQ